MKKNYFKRSRFSVAVMVLINLIIIGVVVLYAYYLKNTTTTTQKEAVRRELNSQMGAVRDQIDNGFSVLRGFTKGIDSVSVINKDYIVNKTNTLKANSIFEGICFVYGSGKGYEFDGDVIDISDRALFKKAIKGNEVLEYNTIEESIDFAVPVMEDGEVQGVIVGHYGKDKFHDMFEKIVSSKTDICYICTSDGDIVTSINFKSGENGQLKEQIASNIGAGKFVTNEGSYYENEGKGYYIFCDKLTYGDWYVFKALPERNIHNEVLRVAIGGYIMATAVLVGVLLLTAMYIIRERRNRKELLNQAEKFKYIAQHDELTKLYTYETFEKKARKVINTVDGEWFIGYADFHKFKMVNEMLGFERGNDILIELADCFQSIADKYSGLCCRINGDRFAMLLPYKDEVKNELEKITNNFKRAGSFGVEIYLYIGIYPITDKNISVATMIDCATIAQTTIKGNYEHSITEYDEVDKEHLIEEQEIVNSMEDALKNGEFIFYLQPQYDSVKPIIIGAEALVRWKKKDGTFVPLGKFLPIFERNGFITKMDEYVWEQVCIKQRQWIDEGKDVLPISINVSKVDFMQRDVPQLFRELVNKYNISPDLLKIEITETAYVDNPQQLIEDVLVLKKYGFVVEMDDFGSGYSSLNMLKDLPVDVIKTDLKFLDRDENNKRGNKIMEYVVRMILGMNLSVIAEGVETKEQVEYLQKMNCVYMQGYYFSRPIPVDEFEKLAYGDKQCQEKAENM